LRSLQVAYLRRGTEPKELEAVLLGDKQTYIKRFDGADVPSLIKYGAYHGFELHVLPGYHDLTVYAYFGFDSGAVSGYTRYSTADLRFQAEAGKTYAIRYKRESASIRYWIEPVETQKQAN